MYTLYVKKLYFLEIFNNKIRIISDALKLWGFQEKTNIIRKTLSDPYANKKRKRRLNTVWFNRPYSMNIKVNTGKGFWHLLHKPFLPAHLFNRNTVKINYICMYNMNSIILNTIYLKLHYLKHRSKRVKATK